MGENKIVKQNITTTDNNSDSIETIAETFARILVAFIDDMESKKGKKVGPFSE